MQLNTYTAILGFLLLIFFINPTFTSAQGQDMFDLQFKTEVDCGQNLLTATLQLKARSDSFRIGTSSILFNYDENVLEFIDYESLNFDEKETVEVFGQVSKVWDAHKFNSSFAGICNLTLLLEFPIASRPTIDTNWIDIGKAKFNIKNINASPKFKFDLDNSNFNRHQPNDGSAAPEKGNFAEFDVLLATKCDCVVPTVNNDTIVLDSLLTDISFNVLNNDIVSNPTIMILSGSGSGTASITPNGQLNYPIGVVFCGTDSLRYKVCNDGKENCCAEGLVIIEFKDAIPPAIINGPTDITVSCDSIPQTPNLFATDNSNTVDLFFDQTESEGECADLKNITRIWTAVDGCGNETKHIQQIFVTDTEAPTIECPPSFTISCREYDGQIFETGNISFRDNCTDSSNIVVSFVDEVISDSCNSRVQKLIYRVWKATDLCGNFSTCIQEIKIIDVNIPIIICPDDITVNCGQSIHPDALGSAIAYDSCSTVSITYTDSEALRDDCQFDQKIIERLWWAEDACGNVDTCYQKIIVNGNPCPPTIAEDRILPICSGETINIYEYLGLSANTRFVLEGVEVDSNGNYFYVNQRCEVFTKGLEVHIYDENDCLVKIIDVAIQILPEILVGVGHEGNNFCSPRLFFECPDLYKVTWKDNLGNTGEGAVYEGAPGTSGYVAFYVESLDTTLSQYACSRDTLMADFSCPRNCPDTLRKVVEWTVCAETTVNIFERLDLDTTLQYVVKNDAITDGIYQVGNPFGCEMGAKEYEIKGYNNQQCLVEIIILKVKVLPAIYGGITSVSDSFCKVNLGLECPDNYKVTWEDSFGNVGEGMTYMPTSNTAGTVTFTVEFLPSTVILSPTELACYAQTFTADFNCGHDCLPTVVEDRILPICSGETINIFEYLGLSPNTRFVLEGVEVDSNGNYSYVNQRCEVFTKGLEVHIYDEKDCLVKIISVAIQILPEILVNVDYERSDFCSPRLAFECPDLYQVTWTDNLGNTGEGAKYEGVTGTSGYVTFYVESLDSNLLQYPCSRDTLFADFSCPSACPDTLRKAVEWTVCALTTENIFERLDLDTSLYYSYNTEAITDGIYQVGNPFGCEMGTKEYEIKGYNDQQCLVEIISVKVTILPAIYGGGVIVTDTLCNLTLYLECPENYLVKWTDNLGNSGEGFHYSMAENTSGTVTFTVEYLTDGVILSATELACFSESFSKEFNCSNDCPASVQEERFLAVCGEENFNVFDYLDLNPNTRVVLGNFTTDDNGNYIFVNDGCEPLKKELSITIYDENNCPIKIITIRATILPKLAPVVSYLEDSCKVKLELECIEYYTINWVDNLGNSGEGNLYEASLETTGTVIFSIRPKTEFNTSLELTCLAKIVEARFNCPIPCPTPIPEVVELFGCHGDIVNLFQRLEFSDHSNYKVVNTENPINLEAIALENTGSDCGIKQTSIFVEVSDSTGCVQKVLNIVYFILPEIKGSIQPLGEGCGVRLELACPDLYDVSWVDNQGIDGEGLVYEGTIDTPTVINYTVAFKDQSIAAAFPNKNCLSVEFSEEVICCNPVGTACDDGNPDTFGDQEDGECGCAGTPCALEHKGKVKASPNFECGHLIELEDGTIFEIGSIPEGTRIVEGQELIFSYIVINDPNHQFFCPTENVIQIICLENICPAEGTPCSDGDLATINDVHDGNCNCVGETAPPPASQIDLRFKPILDCESNSYCVTLQAKTQEEDVTIGTSSIMLNYNRDALEFTTYESIQFDDNETCIQGTFSPWGAHSFDATSVAGKFSLVLNLNAAGVSCPEITTTEWESIGTICFDIMDNQAAPKVVFDEVNTMFNSSTPNDGSQLIPLGKITNIETDEALGCTSTTPVPQTLALKAILQGAYMPRVDLMRDALRKKEYIPLREPYTGYPSYVHFGEGGGEFINLDVLQENSNTNAIVDWVFLEIRADTSANSVVTTKSALIQRDGDIVDVDGISPVQLEIPNGEYFICVKHRNHLGMMTANPITFDGETPIDIDFTNPATETWGTHAQFSFNGKTMMWGGNANPDKYIILAGGGLGLPDRDMIFFDIFLSLWYANPGKPISYNSVLHGYYNSDTNLDGQVKYQGPRNDIDAIIFFNVLFHPENSQYRLNFAITEQIP